MKNKQSTTSVVVLANAGELVRTIAQGVLGNDVADTFAGSELSRDIVHGLAQSRFQASLSKQMGAQ